MNRPSVCRASDPRQLDFLSFTPVVLPVDRGPPPAPEPPPLRIVPVAELPEIQAEPDRPLAPTVAKQRVFRITDAERLGEGSLRQKCEYNLAAIELLKQLEAEGRPATEAEQRTLVRYVGWGGLPQVFDFYNDDWKVQRHRLEQLLTEDALTSARATTLNAHYTSPVIVRGMYAALARFGFRHGRILEPACGLGHFIGLMPEEMHAHSTITGIEIDQLTARIAKALGITQDSVSRLEKRSDLLLSTLRKTVKAMGGSLSLVAEFPDSAPVVLSGIANDDPPPKSAGRKDVRAPA